MNLDMPDIPDNIIVTKKGSITKKKERYQVEMTLNTDEQRTFPYLQVNDIEKLFFVQHFIKQFTGYFK